MKHTDPKQTTAKYILSFVISSLDWEEVIDQIKAKFFMDDDPLLTGGRSSDRRLFCLEFYSNFKEDIDFIISVLPNGSYHITRERV